jgi:hypothetical protein
MTGLEAAAGSTGAPGAPELPPLTLTDELAHLAPGWDLAELCRWPPDVFAFTAATLADSGSYRCVVNPPAGHVWPPLGERANSWEADLRDCGLAWAALAAEGETETIATLERLRQLADSLADAGSAPLAELDRPERWQTLAALLHLNALADEASAGAGIRRDTQFQRRVAALLETTGSLARLPVGRGRVLPKLRPPASGITLRSLSHHLALDRSEVETRWIVAPPVTPNVPATDRFTMLLVPQPAVIHASDFRPVSGPLANMDEARYGFYEFVPEEPFDLDEVVPLVARAHRHVGDIDLLVLPEGALDETEVPTLQRLLVDAGVPYLIAGVRQSPRQNGGFGGNYAHFGAGDWQAPSQHKHHRWCLDAGQVHQYHLGSALDPRLHWWEAIGVPRRSLTFVTVSQQLTICPLVCEDLARPDPVTDVIRSIAPTLVVALLLDGPQLAARWPARYASVLADDPGCSVLTLTALGMAQRSQPPGCAASRAIALWKDPHRGLHQIALAEGARAVALTAYPRNVQLSSADGRVGKEVAELVLSGIEQID